MNDPDFDALNPFFEAIKRMLGPRVDGEHFFDLLTEDAVWEYGFVFEGTIGHVRGRDAIREHFRGYHRILWLDSIDHEIVHSTPKGAILEYHSHGRGTQTGRPYNNQYVSVIEIVERKIVHWRDYSNKLAVLATVGDIASVSSAMGSEA